MRKIILLCLIGTISLLSGCRLFTGQTCEEDGVMVPFSGNENRTYKNYDIGLLNQCNETTQGLEEAGTYIYGMDHETFPRDLIPEHTSQYEQRYYNSLLQDRSLTRDDLRTNLLFTQIERTQLQFHSAPTFLIGNTAFERTNSEEPFVLTFTYDETYTNLMYVEPHYTYIKSRYPYYQTYMNSQTRQYYKNDVYVFDNFIYSVTENHQHFMYRIYQEGIGYYAIDYVLIYNPEYDNYRITINMTQYDVASTSLYQIEYRYYENAQIMEIIYHNNNDQISYKYHTQKYFERDYWTDTLDLTLYENDTMVLTYKDMLRDIDTSQCESLPFCDSNQLTTNLKYLSGWEEFAPTDTKAYHLLDTEGTNLLDSFENGPTQLLQASIQTIVGNEITGPYIKDPTVVVQLDQFDPITKQQFEHLVPSLTYTGPYTFDDVISRYDTYLQIASDQFAVTNSSFVLFDQEYDYSPQQELYEHFLPKEFARYLKNELDMYE